jgi:hypothetical protein
MADRTPKGGRLRSETGLQDHVLEIVVSYEERIRSLLEDNQCLRKLEALQESEIDRLKANLLEYEHMYDVSVVKIRDLARRHGHVLSLDEVNDLLSQVMPESKTSKEPASESNAFEALEETVRSAAELERTKAQILELECKLTLLSFSARQPNVESKSVQTEMLAPKVSSPFPSPPTRATLPHSFNRNSRMLDPPTPLITSLSPMRPHQQFVFPQSSPLISGIGYKYMY